jgi:drug/metabolite transporter (DMT)-like permease
MSLQALFWTLLAQAIGGVTPILTKLALQGLGPWQVVAGRQVLGTLILLVLARATHAIGGQGHRPFDRRDWLLVFCLAWAGFALPMALLAHGIERSTAVNGALLSPVEPIGILLGGALVLGERLTRARAAAVVLGAAGASLIVLGGEVTPGAGDLFGNALIFAGYLAWSIYTLAAKPLVARHDVTRLSFFAIALTVPPFLLLAAREPIQADNLAAGLFWVALLAFTSTALATYSWNKALVSISAGTMAAFIFVQPVVGLAVGVILLAEPVSVTALAGTLLAVAGVTIAALRGEIGTRVADATSLD